VVLVGGKGDRRWGGLAACVGAGGEGDGDGKAGEADGQTHAVAPGGDILSAL
jgi:hypothetical protein